MRLTAQLFCDIIKDGMSLGDDQIWIYNQRRSIPEDKRLYVIVGLSTISPYANQNQKITSGTGMQEELSQYVEETISVDLISYTTEAVERYHEAIGSLMTTYATQVQELNALKIYTIPESVNDVSQLEGAALVYRISIILRVYRKYSMIKDVSYFDTFSVDDDLKTEQ
jgi:hypothetical protein